MEIPHGRKNFYRLYWLLLAVLLGSRVLHLFLFSFKYADSDQTILWVGAVEMLQGRFHEPGFYGQAYNTLFESLLAVPLLALGLPVYKALPVVAAMLALAPFILLSALAYRKGQQAGALLFLAVPLVLPSEYVFITQLPRGFVAGVFMAAVAMALLLFAEKPGPKRLFLSGLAGGISLALNPNGLLLLVFIYSFTLLNASQKLKTMAWLFLGALPGIGWQGYVAWFYHAHPEYLIHSYPDKSFSFYSFAEAASRFHELFYGLFPALFFAGAAIVVVWVVLIIRLHKRGQKNASRALLATLLFVMVACFSSKITDGTASVFFPYSRMFLALPVLMAVAGYILLQNAACAFTLKKLRWITGCVLVLAGIKCTFINDRINWNLRNNSGMVKVFKTGDMEALSEEIEDVADSTGLNTLLIFEKRDDLNYGVMALSEGDVKTISLAYERKTWLLKQFERQPPKTFLFWCEDKWVPHFDGLAMQRVHPHLPLYKATTELPNALHYFEETGVLTREY